MLIITEDFVSEIFTIGMLMFLNPGMKRFSILIKNDIINTIWYLRFTILSLFKRYESERNSRSSYLWSEVGRFLSSENHLEPTG